MNRAGHQLCSNSEKARSPDSEWRGIDGLSVNQMKSNATVDSYGYRLLAMDVVC